MYYTLKVTMTVVAEFESFCFLVKIRLDTSCESSSDQQSISYFLEGATQIKQVEDSPLRVYRC